MNRFSVGERLRQRLLAFGATTASADEPSAVGESGSDGVGREWGKLHIAWGRTSWPAAAWDPGQLCRALALGGLWRPRESHPQWWLGGGGRTGGWCRHSTAGGCRCRDGREDAGELYQCMMMAVCEGC